MQKLHEDIVIHNELNPKFWRAGKLLPEVRQKLIETVVAFEEYIDTPIQIVDIQLCGSNASYNYTDKSDLDTHIVANFDVPGLDSQEAKSILQKLYDAKKTEFNKNYDISIYGNKVEVYVQDIKSTIVSNGVYSVCENLWVKEPKQLTSVKNPDTSKEILKWQARIAEVLSTAGEYPEEVQNTLNKLYLIRHNSLVADGEFGKGNQLFKELRALGLVQDLKDTIKKTTEQRLSLEGLSMGQIANRLE